MYPNALIVADTYDCKRHMLELIQHCASFNLKPKVIHKNHWPSYFRESLSQHSKPILYYANPSMRHSKHASARDYHERNPHFPILLSKHQEVISFRPDLVSVRDDGQFEADANAFRFSEITTHRLKPPVEPITICLLLHERNTYAQLAYNSIIYSLGEYVDEVPIVLVLNGNYYGMNKLAKEASQRDNVEVIRIEPNCGSAASYYIRKWFEANRPETENIILMEDDFILPSAVRNVYPHWPWEFASRLEHFDLVCWLPSLDNLPQIYFPQTRLFDYRSVESVSRNALVTQSWIDSDSNPNMHVTGNAIAFSLKFYDLACLTVTQGSVPTDYNLFQIAHRVCSPKMFGYHIGWNQEQDGYRALNDLTRWPDMVKRVDIYADKLDRVTTIGF